jgi:hypothetical protein
VHRIVQSGPIFLNFIFIQEEANSAQHIEKENSGSEERQHACKNTTAEKGTGLAIGKLNLEAAWAMWL